MSRETVGKLVDRWMNDAEFRRAMRADPEGAVKRSGFDLGSDEWAALRTIDWSQSDDQLRARASKVMG